MLPLALESVGMTCRYIKYQIERRTFGNVKWPPQNTSSSKTGTCFISFPANISGAWTPAMIVCLRQKNDLYYPAPSVNQILGQESVDLGHHASVYLNKCESVQRSDAFWLSARVSVPKQSPKL